MQPAHHRLTYPLSGMWLSPRAVVPATLPGTQ